MIGNFWERKSDYGLAFLTLHFKERGLDSSAAAISQAIQERPEEIAEILAKTKGLQRLFGPTKQTSPSGYALIAWIALRIQNERRKAA